MYKDQQVTAIIPARDEALSIGKVVSELTALKVIDRIVVCDNGSSDTTAEKALAAGAEVVFEPVAGYGRACQTALLQINHTDIVLFVDADDSLRISESINLLETIYQGADLAIGQRIKAWQQPGSVTLVQDFGNRLAGRLINLIWRYPVTDLGPFRAIRYAALKRLNMQDQRFGWTVEMQVKAIQQQLTIVEIPVHYQQRIGQSKISGTIRGVIGAGYGIISTIIKLALAARFKAQSSNNLRHIQPSQSVRARKTKLFEWI